LRDILNDDLFVRTPNGMQPTTLASEICPRVHSALANLQDTLQPTFFDPARSTRVFRLVGTTYVMQVLAPHLADRFMKEAPSASLEIFAPSRILVEELSDGGIDVAVGIGRPLPPWIEAEEVLKESWVMAVRADLAPEAKCAA